MNAVSTTAALGQFVPATAYTTVVLLIPVSVKVLPVPNKFPPVAASYQLIGSEAVAVSVMLPVPQLPSEVTTGAVETGFMVAIDGTRVLEHPFFASALLRRTLDLLVGQIRTVLGNRGIEVQVWQPSVVFTTLSEAFAQTLPPALLEDSPEARLKSFFRITEIPTAQQYVESMLLSK